MRRTLIAAVALFSMAACTPESPSTDDPRVLDGSFSEWGGVGTSSPDSLPLDWAADPTTAWKTILHPVAGQIPGEAGVFLAPGASVSLTHLGSVAITPGHTYHLVLDAERLDQPAASPGNVVMALDWLGEGCVETVETFTLTSTSHPATDKDPATRYDTADVQAPSSARCARVRLLLSGGKSGVRAWRSDIQLPWADVL